MNKERHSGVAVSTVSSQQKGPGFDFCGAFACSPRVHVVSWVLRLPPTIQRHASGLRLIGLSVCVSPVMKWWQDQDPRSSIYVVCLHPTSAGLGSSTTSSPFQGLSGREGMEEWQHSTKNVLTHLNLFFLNGDIIFRWTITIFLQAGECFLWTRTDLLLYWDPPG